MPMREPAAAADPAGGTDCVPELAVPGVREGVVTKKAYRKWELERRVARAFYDESLSLP